MTTTSPSQETLWQAALDGDRAAFNRLVEPHLNELLRAARRDIGYHRFMKDLLPADLTPEELVGETLVRAWYSRREKPEAVRLRAWLLGTQHRVLQKLIEREKTNRALWAVSLEAPLPPEPLYDDEESFWEWYQPDDITKWEDVFPDDVPLPDEQLADEEAIDRLATVPRQALLLRDVHKLTIPEVAYALQLSVAETVTILREAREQVRAGRQAED
ncbi:RNA polymerase sigma factor [Rhodocaloribacter litoris]|uniref:RNA polymerase sigma factor n=1 Tax=Rhodocaloribacter litoris TaxID=2558931 RepID=UPI00141FB426|nr:RNA polymerase sigma factor [Rhodocaloribacter litoris]QXD13774.1 RNA polymerase sigma factor [Rhodocaloribacter litoris]